MIRSAPICFADNTPSNPTAPSPTTATIDPGFTSAASAANQPVPSTSEAVKRLATRSSDGRSFVATSVPSASGTRKYGACAPDRNCRCAHDDWNPCRQCAQVLSEAAKEPTTNCPFRIVLTSLPTSSTMPQYSWPIGVGPAIGCSPRYGHRSDPHTHAAEILMIASLRSISVGSGIDSNRTSPAPCNTVPFIAHLAFDHIVLAWRLLFRPAVVLIVGHVFHPVDRPAVELLLDGDVRHRGCRRGAVPVPFSWREPHDVAGLDLLDRPAVALHAPE